MISVEIILSIVRSDLSRESDRSEEREESSDMLDVKSPVTMLHRMGVPAVTSDQVLQFYKCNPSASYVTAAANLNIARQTVSRHVSKLLEDGKIQKDGDRFVVPDQDSREFA
jgi:predicted HTH transcriptional regulator